MQVHYKEVVPPSVAGSQDPEAQQLAIVLVHGFGAGVFAWRHVMEPLAYQCQCRVLAFDRPAFGERWSVGRWVGEDGGAGVPVPVPRPGVRLPPV